MSEERRDSSIFVLGILIAAALALYGLYTEGNPTVVEIVELVTNHVVKYLEPKTITRVDKQVVYLTATPGPSINEFIYSTPIAFSGSAITTDAALTESEIEATLRALTPIVPTEVVPTKTLVQRSWIGMPPPPPSTMPPMRTEAPAAPTLAPAAPTEVPAAPTEAPPPQSTMPPIPTEAPAPPTEVPAPPTVAPTVAPPTQVPPTQVPPTQVPPTQVPPTQVPPTQVPPTQVPPTQVPPTQVPPTQIPPTQIPPTVAPPTEVPQVMKQLTPVPVAPLQVEEKSNPELPPTSNGMATLQGHIDFIDESSLTLILTNGDYYNGFDVASDGEFWFENVPNGTYNLSIAGQSGCGQITVSVPEGHRTLTYNYRFYRMQCALIP